MKPRLGTTPYAIVDLETTGLYPGGHDRIVEIAILRYRADGGELEQELTSLVNPHRDIGRTDIHGISTEDLQHAPTFADIAGDVSEALTGAVLVGHNVGFDVAFLRAEFERVGVLFPTFPTVCTLHLACQLPEAPGRALHACCVRLGLEHRNPHTACGDAWATLGLLNHCARHLEPRDLSDLGCSDVDLVVERWCSRLPTGLALPRSDAAVLRAQDRSYLSRLVDKLPGTQGRTIREAEYLCAVDRALEDRRLLRAEADALTAEAKRLGMSPAEVRGAHEAFVWALAREAKADGIVTDIERHDLELVAELLGVPLETVREILDDEDNAPPKAPLSPKGRPRSLEGRSVCFTGELLGHIDGARVTREMAEALATRYGLTVLPGVSRKLDILVVADPATESAKARKAREFGTRIMAEAAFWQALAVRVD
jgi:DNA polymerase-3 subunit epsilon